MDKALQEWRAKLEFLQAEEVTAQGSQKFTLRKEIAEAKAKIAEMEGGQESGFATVLHQIPAPPRDFVGREQDLRELRAGMAQGGVAISGLQGMGGVGKTALALKLAAELAASYPDAGLYLDLKGVDPSPVSVAGALSHCIRAFHPTAQLPDDEAQLRARFLSVLHDKRALLVLDNARDAAQVEPLLPPASCAVIVTSRRYFTVPGLVPQHLDALPPDDARALLLGIAPRIGACGAEMARVLGYLPLALRLAAGALAQRPNLTPEAYLRRLADARARLALVEAPLRLSYDLLEAAAQARWRALAVFPDSFDDAATAAVWEMEADAATDALGDLLAWGMVDWNEATRRYRLHDLARDFAAACLSQDETEFYAAQKCHATHYEQVLREARELYEQGHDAVLRSLKLFDDERVNIEAGQSWAAAHAACDNAATRLCMNYPDAGVYVLLLRQSPREQIAWLEAALAAARQLKDLQYEGNALGNLGLAYTDLGQTRRAIEYHEQYLAIAHEIGDRRGEGNALGNLGNAYVDLGQTRRAIECYEQYLAIAREIADQRGEGNALGNLGLAYTDLGQTRRAIEYHEQALPVLREIGDRRGEGNVLGNLGIAYFVLGAARRAIEYYEQALKIDREIGDRRGEGTDLWNMSLALDALGERARAVKLAEAALKIREQIEDPNAAMVRHRLAAWRGAAE